MEPKQKKIILTDEELIESHNVVVDAIETLCCDLCDALGSKHMNTKERYEWVQVTKRKYIDDAEKARELIKFIKE